MNTQLQAELEGLKATALAAAGHPFVPAPARDAITQACFVIELLAHAVMDRAPVSADSTPAPSSSSSEADRVSSAMDRLASAIEIDTALRRDVFTKTDKIIDLVWPRLQSEFAPLMGPGGEGNFQLIPSIPV